MLGFYNTYDGNKPVSMDRIVFRLTLVNRKEYNGVIVFTDRRDETLGKENSFNPTWAFWTIKYYKLNKKDLKKFRDEYLLDCL